MTPSNATGDAYYSGTGTTVWFRPAGSGSFDVTASSSDADTGIQGYTFPTAGAMGANWTPSGSGASRSKAYEPARRHAAGV